ncbi:MAG: hypothetical protein A2Z21_02210 [Candidatus Fraserbacteria bacterium RBG_16_55_9]|uniref:Rad50/SbcC-type AAA domain-containing protein n=1 Tax=Fraserbacteria sp. (strain RBG_16_55_9) TaxID=1817864 RepID=A0A1F5V1M0_FRAXR|nr:MAG: hypothetical protein A2Z21_02210 [Candidatus Fraserbacteria bacterium RBG_16_55_9]
MPKKKEQSLLDLLTQTERGPIERDLPQSRPSSKKHPVLPKESHSPVMQLESLEIKNLWCYEQAEIAFEDGVTVIAGPNGSGKSSLLESIFFALYGSKAGPAMDRPLADVLRIGANVGSVQLKFCYGPQKYIAQMALRRRGENVISEKEDCRLTRDDGEEWVGVENVSQAIEEFFGMNRDDFTNCVYVRQGEIDRLIRAGEEERRRMIDRLLRLEKLDRYAGRAREGARRALNRRMDVLRQLCSDFKREIEKLQAQNLERSRGDLEEKLRNKQAELKDLEKKISQAEEVQHGLKEKLRRIEEQTREIKERTEELTQKEDQFKQSEGKAQRLHDERENLKKRYKQLEDELDKGLSQLKMSKDPIVRSLNKASRWEEVEVLPQELAQTKTQQESLHVQIRERQVQMLQKAEKLSRERESLLKALVQAETQEQDLKRELEEAHALIRQGKCPVCKQPVHNDTFGSSLTQKESTLQKLAGQIQSEREKLQVLESQTGALKKEEDKAIWKLNEEFTALEARRSQLDGLKELTLHLLKVKEQGLDRKNTLNTAVEALEILRDELTRMKAKISDLKTQLGDTSELHSKSQKVQEVLTELATQKETLQKHIGDLLQERGKVDTQLGQLKKYQEALAQTEEELATIERLQAELEQLTEFYGALKRELRVRNIKALELYFNHFFQLMDSGASYRGVRVSEEYDIAVELKNGSVIRPDLLSGGERALINIALRSAIHQVLAQASTRMPLILDEPTIYLDRDRVSRLQFLLEELGGRIGQVIVVSHEMGLVEGADHEYRTEKTADNTSRVTRVR